MSVALFRFVSIPAIISMYRINKLENSVKELNRKVDSCLVAKTIVLKIKDKKSNNVNDSITTKKK